MRSRVLVSADTARIMKATVMQDTAFTLWTQNIRSIRYQASRTGATVWCDPLAHLPLKVRDFHPATGQPVWLPSTAHRLSAPCLGGHTAPFYQARVLGRSVGVRALSIPAHKQRS